jgi:hypothetical protein
MSQFKGVPTDKLQAEYDAGIKTINELTERHEALNAELSRRSNARTFILNQVIAGESAQLLANGIDPAVIADAEAYVASEKARKAQLRAERAAAPSGVAGGAS